MTEFKTDFKDIYRDIDRWMKLHGTPGKLSSGTPVLFGGSKATAYVTNLYFEHEAWDALVARYAETTSWSAVPEFVRLNDTLVRRGDVRRLKRLWGSVIAEMKSGFWEFHTHCRRARVPGSIESQFYEGERDETLLTHEWAELLYTVEHTRRLMLQLGETDYARQLAEDYARIERGERGKKLAKPILRAMDEDCFWELIEIARRQSGSAAEQKERLLSSLEAFKAGEISKFGKLLAEKMNALYRWDVWALAHIALGGCSDDMFEYFRAWLILQGRELFEAALADVERLGPKIPHGETSVEGLLGIVATAYENRSGKPLRAKTKEPPTPAGKPWEEADLPVRYPALTAYFP
jgi:hypothetical protein